MTRYHLPIWHEDRLLLTTVLGVSVLSSWLWWVPLRCIMDGPAFQWANTFGAGVLRGSGMGGDFLALVLISGLFMTVVYTGLRGARAPFPALLLFWTSIIFAGTFARAWSSSEGYRFRGDTMGIDVDITWTMPALDGLVLLLAAIWVFREWRAPRRRTLPRWTKLNALFLWPVVLLLPFQVVLLRVGPMHDTTDVIGWILTYAEWVLINLALLPWQERETATVET